MTQPLEPASLTIDGCRTRQKRLLDQMASLSVDAAMVTDRRHVHYLAGWWSHQYIPSVLVLKPDGHVTLVCNDTPADPVAADDIVTYEAQKLCTFVHDRAANAARAALPALEGMTRLACDEAPRPGLLGDRKLVDLSDALLTIRRTKDEDEVAMLRRSILATEAAIARVRDVIQPGMTEVQMCAHIHAAAVEAAGELIDEMGNDFQANAPGGPARTRPMQAGELVPLDLSVCIRGYTSDMCRTIAVDHQPTEKQLQCHELIMGALARVETTIRPGASCRSLYNDVKQMIDGQQGWSFFHHLGHGIGLCGHEAPRLNPNWDDTLQVGDVITAEPGLYGDDLNNGIRIEQNYLITADGFELLTKSSTDL